MLDAVSGGMQAARGHAEDHDFFGFKTASHQVLDDQLDRTMAAIEANELSTLDVLWIQLEARVLAHLEAEERFVLPTFARVDPAEAMALLREHGHIREQLLELGVAFAQHYIRPRRFAQLVTLLRAHARREDQLLYQWAITLLDARLAAAAQAHIASTERVRPW
jgi:hypothetical protein